MSQVTEFRVGQKIWQSALLDSGRDVDNSAGDCWTTKKEADGGAIMKYVSRTGRLNASAGLAYVKRIRNQRKAQYAMNYLDYLSFVNAPQPSSHGLSMMAAQAVRMRLAEMVNSPIIAGATP